MINMKPATPGCMERYNNAAPSVTRITGPANGTAQSANSNIYGNAYGNGVEMSRNGMTNGGVRNLTGSNGNGNVNRNTNQPANGETTGMESEIAPMTDAESLMLRNGGMGNQMAQANGAGGQMTPANGTGAQSRTTPNDGGEYGPGYDWTPAEEEGMTSIPQDDFDQPLNADEIARSSWRALLARNIGRNVLVSFLIGTQNTVVAEGELYEVGTDYLVIYQPLWNSHISADLYAVKFVEFREPPGQTLN